MSDLHLTEIPLVGSVTDEQLGAFVDRLARLGSPDLPVKVVFIGDILELLRSTKWGDVWRTHQSAPWSGMCVGFKNFRGGHAEACALSIAQGIRIRYSGFAERLRMHVDAGTLTTEYLYGNHDYMVQLSPAIREVLIDLLALDRDPGRRFDSTYDHEPTSLLATHGHTCDPVNWHDEAGGRWAMGDAVVLRVVNRFVEEAGAVLGLTPATHVGQLLQDIENVESILDIPLFVNWIAEQHISSPPQRARFRATWKTIVDEFLSIEEFSNTKMYNEPQFKRLRQGFELSTHLGLADLLARFASWLDGGGIDYVTEARRLGIGSKRRFVVFGHTHEPALVPVGTDGDKPCFYINTGCWRRVISRPGRTAPVSFAPRRLASYLLVDAADGAADLEHYHLHHEWHAS